MGNHQRLPGGFWQVIIDGTQLYSSREKPDEKCLRRVHSRGTEKEYTEYGMKYVCTVISVADIKAARKFYEDLFSLEVYQDYGRNITFTCGLALQQDFDWLVNLPKEKVLNKSNNAEIVFEEQDFDGFLSKLKEYSNIECLGEVIEHSWGQRVIRFYDLDGHINHGLQFEVESYDEVLIPSKEGIIAYLSSGKIKGIGPKVAERIYAAFGLRTLDVLDKEPERLLSISGIGEDKLRKICDSYPENRGARLVYSSPLFRIFS